MGLAKCPDPSDAAYAYDIYPYCPSFEAALLFTILFGLVMIAHIAQAIIYRKSYSWVIAMAALWEALGWGFRAASTLNEDNRNETAVTLYILATVFVLMAPIWLNAFVYMTFGRMVHYFMPEKKVAGISAQRLTLLFVGLDITAFLIQVIGAVQLTGQNVPMETVQRGLNTYIGGTATQELFILFFFGLSWVFFNRTQKCTDHREKTPNRLLYTMWAALGLISIRIFYRIGEYSSGLDGYATSHEWLQYVFDALPMWTAMLLFNISHPGLSLVGPESEFPKLTKAQKKEQREAQKTEKAEKKARKDASNGSLPLETLPSYSQQQLV